jgi:hypothetical protein
LCTIVCCVGKNYASYLWQWKYPHNGLELSCPVEKLIIENIKQIRFLKEGFTHTNNSLTKGINLILIVISFLGQERLSS